jgi:hypothetical protein
MGRLDAFCPFPTIQPFLNLSTQIVEQYAIRTGVIFVTMRKIKFDFPEHAYENGKIVFYINVVAQIPDKILDKLNDLRVDGVGHHIFLLGFGMFF